MSTMEATISMLEAMPEEARRKVLEFTRQLFTAGQSANPFVPVTTEQILGDLEESRTQISEGQGIPMEDALTALGKEHGFL